MDPAESDIMERKPKKTKGIFTKGMTWRIIYQGIMIGLVFTLVIGFLLLMAPLVGV